MTNLLEEKRLSLTQLAKREGVAAPTTWRWAQRGVKGVKLETINVGGRRFTSCEAFIRFVEATTAAANGEPAAPRSETNRQSAARATRTDAGLSAHGI